MYIITQNNKIVNIKMNKFLNIHKNIHYFIDDSSKFASFYRKFKKWNFYVVKASRVLQLQEEQKMFEWNILLPFGNNGSDIR